PTLTRCLAARSRFRLSIMPGSPKPLSMMAQPSAANAVAMPRPMPLVEPVTIAALPCNIFCPLAGFAAVTWSSRRVMQDAPRHDARQWPGARPRVEALDDHLAGPRIGARDQHGMPVEHRRRKVGGARERALLQGADRAAADAVVVAGMRGRRPF